MRRRRGSGSAAEEAEKWEKILASEGLASLPDSVESNEPAPTEFEETSESAQDQPSGADSVEGEDDLPTLASAVDVDEDDEEDELSAILRTRLDINIVELEEQN
jgi:hypothetical protein